VAKNACEIRDRIARVCRSRGVLGYERKVKPLRTVLAGEFEQTELHALLDRVV
jgi:hypothetical protein